MTGRRLALYSRDPDPCQRCAQFAVFAGLTGLEWEMIQPLPDGPGEAPLAVDGSGPVCRDCAGADTLLRVVARGGAPAATWKLREVSGLGGGWTWDMVRLCVGNDRREQLRLPGAPTGLVGMGVIPPSEPGELGIHQAWVEGCGLMPPDDPGKPLRWVAPIQPRPREWWESE